MAVNFIPIYRALLLMGTTGIAATEKSTGTQQASNGSSVMFSSVLSVVKILVFAA
jgi:hypothetical protein